MGRPAKPIPPDEAANMVDRYRRGQSLRFISAATSRDASTVRAVLVKAGVRIHQSGRAASGNWGWSGGLAP